MFYDKDIEKFRSIKAPEELKAKIEEELSLKEKMGYYSNYYFLLKDRKTFKDIKKDIGASSIGLRISILLRKILILIRREKNAYENIKN